MKSSRTFSSHRSLQGGTLRDEKNVNLNLSLLKIPLPILTLIIEKLASRDVITLCHVSKSYRENICHNEKLWQGLMLRKFDTRITIGVVGYVDYYDRKVFLYIPEEKDPTEILLQSKLKSFDASEYNFGYIDVKSDLLINYRDVLILIGKADKYYNYGSGGFFLRDGDLFEYTTIPDIDYGRKMKNVDIFGRNETTWYLRADNTFHMFSFGLTRFNLRSDDSVFRSVDNDWDNRFLKTTVIINGIDGSLSISFIKLRPRLGRAFEYILEGILLLDNGSLYYFFETENNDDQSGIVYIPIGRDVIISNFSVSPDDDLQIYWVNKSGKLNLISTSDILAERLGTIFELDGGITKLYNVENELMDSKRDYHYDSMLILTSKGHLYIRGYELPALSKITTIEDLSPIDEPKYLMSNVYDIAGTSNDFYVVIET